MDSNRLLFGVIALIGVVIILLVIFAHSLGLANKGFGTKHIIGLIIGIAVLAVGAWGYVRNSQAVSV